MKSHLLFLALLIAGSSPLARGSNLVLVSSNNPALSPPVGAGGDSQNAVITPDGRFVVFASSAANLVLAAGTDQAMRSGNLNVFLRDRTAATTALVSLNLAMTGGGNGDSIPIDLSTNGQFVLFESDASDLVPGDTNAVKDIFLRDVLHGRTILVSMAADGACANGPSSQPAMTPDGLYVAFTSSASNIVPNHTNGIPDVFIRDVVRGETSLASPGAIQAGDTRGSGSPRITPDGRFVAFLSSATNLVPDIQSSGDVYVRDLVAGTTRAVSAGVHTFFTTNPVCYNHAISDDGLYVAFEASRFSSASAGMVFRYNLPGGATDLISTNAVAAPSGMTGVSDFRTLDMSSDGRLVVFLGRTNGGSQVYLYDGQKGTTALLSAGASDPAPTNSVCDFPVLDPTGGYLCFASTATNLTTNVVADGFHLYVRDLASGALQLVDKGINDVASVKALISWPVLTAGGQAVLFDASDSDLVPGDVNFRQDVFVRDLAAGTNDFISARDAALPSDTPAGIAPTAAFSVSADGRFVAFASAPGNLIPDCTNLNRAVMVRDLANGSVALATVDTNGLPLANGMSADPSMSADGRLVAFASGASNLVPGDTNGLKDVFIRDLHSGTTTCVSVSTNGLSPGNYASSSPTMSSDGRYVLFRSRAKNLAPQPPSAYAENLFLRDLQSATTYVLSPAGVCGASMTPDGRFVVLGGASANVYLWDSQLAALVYTNLTAAVTNVAISADGNRIAALAGSQLYVSDRAAGANFILVPSTNLTWRSGAAAQFSADGRFLVFSTAAPAVAEDTNGLSDVYLYDVIGQTNLLISRSCLHPGAANGSSDFPSLSPDGRFIAWRSTATDLVAGITNPAPNVFLYDRQTGITTLVSANAFGGVDTNRRSLAPVFSADSQTLLFYSWASDLIAHDFNQAPDIFALGLATGGTVASFPTRIVFAPGSSQPITLRWPAVLGTSYKVQFKSRLQDPAWLDLECQITVNGNQASASDLQSEGQRFYRVTAQASPHD